MALQQTAIWRAEERMRNRECLECQRLQACNHKELSSTKILDLEEELETQMRWQSADTLG